MPSGMPGNNMSVAEKSSGKMTTSFQKLIMYCKKYFPVMITAIVLAIVGSILNIIGPDKISEITDLITEGLATGIDIDAVTSIALLLVVLYGLGFLFNIVQGVIMATVSQKISQQMRGEISSKINLLPLKYFDTTSFGDVLSRVTNDVDTIGQTLNQSLGILVSSITMLIGSLVMMFYTNWILAISAVLATLIGFVLMIVIIAQSQKYFSRQQNELGNINGHIEEIYAGHSIVKVYNATRQAKKEFHNINQKLYTNAWKSQFLSGLMMPLMSFIGNFGYVVVCVVGAILVHNGSITFGVIVAFMMYVRLFTQPLSQIAQAATSLQSTAAASDRVFEFLEEEELSDESEKTKVLKNVNGDVKFKNVNFGYKEGQTIINNFSVDIKAGQKVAIVGPTGAGKTTIVNLLMRFYELNSGSISIDGVPIDEMKRESVHDLFCMVLQDTWIFHGTVRENIAYCKEDISDAEIEKVCDVVGLTHFINTLPNKLDTVLDDNVELSAGQKQLITIARAMIENAPLLILDEATSSIDTRTEILVQKAMDKLTVGRTSFVIAHRLSTIKDADLILVMKDGDIVEKGTHVDLLEQGTFYADLYNSQFDTVTA
ncbi:ABC transporter ATP-binding protein [Breznakia pachnodae]|uniref:ATP-binding cassette subfamily B protein n=1 Tax=Breznakia pachnodae TaxID=265178 RepID=A0ABU0E0M6_9FIRM|nr:ABC transporter ATP-binding protein [Breznakia pachnodae]MDQ0360278.1 ATP-binding cassette subfamily B protein [Breznakia pachnodae]